MNRVGSAKIAMEDKERCKGAVLASDAFFPFAGMEKNSARTFKIETDDLKDPAYLKLVDQNQTSNIITLSSEQVLWPFGDKYE